MTPESGESRPSAGTALARLQELRSRGQLAAALFRINEVFGEGYREPGLTVEGIKLMLLTGDTETAHRLLGHLRTLPAAGPLMHKEFLCRLQLQLGEAAVPEVDRPDIPWSASWVGEYLSHGSDPTLDLLLTDVSLECFHGHIDFEFTTSCPFCSASFAAPVKLGFLLERRLLCPVCFGNLRLGFDQIAEFFEHCRPDLVGPEVARWDPFFVRLQRRLSRTHDTGDEIPRLCRYMNQQYVFMLNELFAARWKGGPP